MNTVVQRFYAPQIAPAVEGMIADEVPSTVLTRICNTAAGIGFGKACSIGTGKTAIVAGSSFLGLSVRDVTLQLSSIDPLSDTSYTVDKYGRYQNMGIMTRGHMWVRAASDVVEGSAVVYYDSVGGLSNSASGSAATGSLTFSQQPADGDVLLLEANNTGTTITFKNVVTNAATQIQIGPTLGDTLTNAAAMLNASVDAHVATINYAAYPPSPGGAGEGSGAYQLLTAAATVGTAGNSITITSTVTGITIVNLSGGLAAGTSITGTRWLTSAQAGDLAK